MTIKDKESLSASQGGEAVACFRILNTLGEVVTDWHDGPPPERFTDVCGVVQTDVFSQVAYTHPADQVDGVFVSRELLERATNFGRPDLMEIALGELRALLARPCQHIPLTSKFGTWCELCETKLD